MKKIIVIALALILSSNIFAQKLSGGLFFAPTYSWLKSDSKTVTPEANRIGYTFGVIADYNLMDNFAISAGVRFNKTGGSLKYVYGIQNFEANEIDNSLTDTLVAGTVINYNLNYIAIPFGFKGKTNEIGYLTYFLKAGITPLINTKAIADIGTLYSDEIISKEVGLFNMGWHIGGGAEYSLSGNTKILFEVIYTGGLIDFENPETFTSDYTSSTAATTNPTTTINDIHLKVGIIF